MAEFILASSHVGDDSSEVVLTYDDATLQILSVTVRFTGEAHFKFGQPDAPRKIILSLDQPVTLDFAHGRKYYLEDTEEGLELPADLKMYIVLDLYNTP